MKYFYQRIPTILLLVGFLLWGCFSSAALLTLLAIGIHEIGHILGAELVRAPFRGFSLKTREARLLTDHIILPYGKELVICAFGPIFNLLSAALALSGGAVLLGSDSLSVFATASVSLAILNLLPVDSFDGGRILSCLFSSFLPAEIALVLCRLASFFALFSLWCVSVYALIKTGESLSLFFFSATLFFRLFFSHSSSQF